MQHTQGALPEALETLDRVLPESVPEDPEGVARRTCRIKVLSMLGRDRQARSLAVETLRWRPLATPRRSRWRARRCGPPSLPGPPGALIAALHNLSGRH